MSNFYRSEIYGSHFVLIIVLLEPMSLLTDGGNITWLEPPPFETVTDASSISRTNKQVIQGSLNEELSCHFSLSSDLRIRVVAMKFGSRPAVIFVPNVLLEVEPAFAKRFNAVWVPNKLTLTLFNVTDAEEGEYSCQVVTVGRSARTWIRKIQLLVVDPMAMVFPITFDQNPIQATVSAITASEDLIQTTVSSITASEDPIQTTVSGVTASEGPIPTTDSITASKVNDQRTAIVLVVGSSLFVIIVTAITIGYLIRIKRSPMHIKVHLGHQRVKDSEERDLSQVQSACTQSGPPAASEPKGQPFRDE